MTSSKTNDRMCPKCNRRKAGGRRIHCATCHAILRSEGVKDKRVTLAIRHKQYLRWREQGLSYQQMADKWGVTRGYVKNVVLRFRSAGYPMPAKMPRQPSVPHGGGKAGIRDCPCEPCTTKRKEYSHNWYITNRDRLKLTEEPTEAPLVRVYRNPRTNHGEGSRGIEGCFCELCVQRRKDYHREWNASRRGKNKNKNASVAQSG